MSMISNVRAILLAKGYRPYALAAALGLSCGVVKQILRATRARRKLEAERQERERRRLANWKPYEFMHTLGGNHLFVRDKNGKGDRYSAAREQYNQYLSENEGRLTKDDIEAEAMRIAKEYLGEDFMERFRERRDTAEVSV